jgi:hypothetical protein
VKAAILGAVFMLAGLVTLGLELWTHKSLHPFNGSVGVGLLVLGALLTDPASVGGALTATLGALKTLLPWKGGQAPPGP